MSALEDEGFVEIDDIRSLRMESELLKLENQYLKARVGESDSSRGEPHNPGPSGVFISQSEYDRLNRGYYDLRWLLRRFEATPARYVFRRFQGWKVLCNRHLDE